MNLYLHGINADPCPIRSGVDSLANDPGERFNMILTNPPFWKRAASRSSTRRATWRRRTTPTSARTSGHDQEQAAQRPLARQDPSSVTWGPYHGFLTMYNGRQSPPIPIGKSGSTTYPTFTVALSWFAPAQT